MKLTKEISSEFEISVYYRYILNDVTVHNVSNTPTATIQSVSHESSKPASSVSTQYVKEVPNPAALSESLPIERQCAALTALGPAPYMGDILDNPDALWTEDVWTEEREEEARQRIAQQGANVNSFWRSKYESKAGSYWHDFYLRNTDKFYKDRHYLHVVFPELISDWRNGSPHGYSADPDTDHDKQPLRLLEVGCGVGNAVIPLLELNPRIHVTAIDFARSAIDILSRHPAVSETGRLAASVCCVVRDDLPVAPQSQDLILCMFVLSAIGPDHQLAALRKLAAALKPGGKLLLRDYGRYDEAQLRFKRGSKLGEDFYVRQDGTCAYFFDLERLAELAAQAGLRVEESENILRQYANRQQKQARYRVWVHAKFVKL